RRDVSAVREDRGQRRERASALSMAQERKGRDPRHRSDQVELHEVSRRSLGSCRAPLRADGYPRKDRGRYRRGALAPARRPAQRRGQGFGSAGGGLSAGEGSAGVAAGGAAGGSSTGSDFITWRLRPSFVFLLCEARSSSATSLSICKYEPRL